MTKGSVETLDLHVSKQFVLAYVILACSSNVRLFIAEGVKCLQKHVGDAFETSFNSITVVAVVYVRLEQCSALDNV